MEELKHWYKENGKHNNRLYQAKERCAGGIVEALEKLSLGPHLSPRDRMGPNGIQPSVPASENGQPKGSGLAQREVVEFNTFFEKWINGEAPNDSETFQRLTSVIVSFCSTTYSCKAFMENVVLRWPDVGSGTLVTMLSTFLRLQGLQWCILGGWRKVSWNLLPMHKVNMASPRTRSSAHG
jgi:hypothetical protein